MGQSSSSLTPEMAEQIEHFVKDLIDNNGIVVFSKTYCPYCTKAKRYLETLGVSDKAHVIELDKRSDGGDIQTYLFQMTKQRTVPNIFINKEHIGGCDDLLGLEKSVLSDKLAKI